jgi:hypothetical protein
VLFSGAEEQQWFRIAVCEAGLPPFGLLAEYFDGGPDVCARAYNVSNPMTTIYCIALPNTTSSQAPSPSHKALPPPCRPSPS